MERILVVEDDRFFRDLFADLLVGQGYPVDCASCGAEALDMLSREQYGLVITDLIMPDISGLEILSHIKENDASVDVMVVTGNADMDSAIFALKHGARDYLIKPVSSDEFLHLVKLCLEQRRIRDENEELRSMLNLFQVSQTIAGCLEIDRICHLLLDATADELGVGRAIGLFGDPTDFELKEIKGLSRTFAENCQEVILSYLDAHPPGTRLFVRTSFSTMSEVSTVPSDAGIDEAYLIFVRNRQKLHGVMVLFNEPGQRLPEFSARKKNILFLMEQAARAMENAQKYVLAKDMLFIDDLSGLFNQRYLEIALERELKRIERYNSHLSILFLDMDYFKQINDTHGHLVGSRVLKETGALLKRSVRDLDVVIRYGGDEFTVILVETPPETACIVAERIRHLIESHVFLEESGYTIRLTCSIGYSCCPEDTVSKEQLLEMADQAMYTGKSRGKNCVVRFTKPHDDPGAPVS